MFKLLQFLFVTSFVNACKSNGEKSEQDSISEMGGIPKLLQKVPNIPQSLTENFNELDKSRSIYQYSNTKIKGTSILNNLPDEQGPDTEWSLLVLDKLRNIRENTLSIYSNLQTWFNQKYPDRKHVFNFQFQPEYKDVLDTVKLIAVKNFDSIIRYYLIKTGYINQGSGGIANEFNDYEMVFPVLPKSLARDIITNDDMFANSYVAGLNPMILEGATPQFRPPIAMDDAVFKKALGFENDSLEIALRENRLYMADLSFMGDTMPGKQNPSRKKYVYGPRGFFAVPKNGSSLRPIAITIDDVKAPQIVTPHDDAMWLIAKTILNSACANHHEIYAHLSQTHLVVDPIIVSFYRHISVNHPLHRLMQPHFRGTHFINSLAVTLLAKEGEVVDVALWGNSESNSRAIEAAVQQYSLNDLVVPKRMSSRRIDNKLGLPNCPYRDDALLIWTAMSTWISSYVDAYYGRDEMVRNDVELRLWVREIQSPFAINVAKRDQRIFVEEQKDQPGGNLKPFGKNGAIETKEDLISFLTVVMFTATAQHASVNFPQVDMMYTPNYPLALYEDLPTGTPSEKDLIKMLPSLDLASLQLEFLGFLGQVYYTQLGNYPTFQFAMDSKVHPAFNNYRKELITIEKTIQQRNSNIKFRPYKYDHLLPSKIPMSINI